MWPAIAAIASSALSGDDAAAAGTLIGGKVNIGSKVVGSGKATTVQDVPSDAVTSTAPINWPVIGTIAGCVAAAVLFSIALIKMIPPAKKKG